MHSYLRAIGFSKIKNKSEQDKLIAAAINNSSAKKQVMIFLTIRKAALSAVHRSNDNTIMVFSQECK